VHILVVPGHEPDNGGTNFGDIYERNLVVPIGMYLENFLSENGGYQTFITRNTTAWNPIFADYFKNNWNQIIAWEQAAKAAWLASSSAPTGSLSGEIANNAAPDAALHLYGITKWADENNIDLMVHIHLNNYPEAMAKKIVGKYSGFIMYMPSPSLKNSAAAEPIAQAIFDRFSLYNPVSNLPVESKGLETDDQLIAMGAYNTADMPSILIECEYIYEPQLVNLSTRDIALRDFAYQISLGIEDYYSHRAQVTAASSYDPADNVYNWQNRVENADGDSKDIYAMQTALIMDGDYPPKGTTGNDCPHSGTFGSCTKAAIGALQKKYGITGEDAFGAKTFSKLLNIYDQNKK
jgi:N-acetylmuramoyl-L-alanine amidase